MKNKLQKAGILVILLSIVGGSLFSFWRTQVFSKNQAVPILCYHKISTDPDPMSISPERFKEQLVALKEMGYHSIGLKELGDLWELGKEPAPGSVVITFDDGYENNYSMAQPILEEQGFSATVFVIKNRNFRTDLLSWDEISELRGKGWGIGSHSWSHVDLAIRPDYHGEVEIKKSRLEIAKKSGGPVDWFAYPYGAWNERTLKWVQESGYQGAVTTRLGMAEKKDGVYQLDRISVTPSSFSARFDLRLRIYKAEMAEFFRWILQS